MSGPGSGWATLDPYPPARPVKRSRAADRFAGPAFGNVLDERDALGAGSCDSESVPIGVFQIALTSGETLFVDRDPELLRDRVDVFDVQVNKRVGPCVPFVFGEIKANTSSRERDEPRKARLELVLPLLLETEALVPGDSLSSILDVEDWDDLFIHAAVTLSASTSKLGGHCPLA